MRKVFLILFLLPIGLFAQSFTETFEIPGKDAATLYIKSKKWFAERMNNTDNETLKEDQTKGILTGKEKFTYMIYSDNVAVNMIATYLLRLSIKDGQYKYEIDNVMIEHGKKFPLSTYKLGTTREGTIEMFKASGMTTPSKKMIETSIDYSIKVVNQFEEEIKRVVESLKESMAN